MKNCPNCGSEVNFGESFCKMCGTRVTLLQNDNQQKNNQNINYSDKNSNLTVTDIEEENSFYSDNELIDAYIGKNAFQIKKGGFSLCTYLFGLFYVFYRKMWLLGFSWIAINLITNTFLTSIADVIMLVVNIIIAFQFKKIYLKKVSESVNEIKEQNPGKSKEQLISLCKKKGGTTIIPIIILIIIIVISILQALSSAIIDSQNQNNYKTIPSIEETNMTSNFTLLENELL